MAGMRWHQSWTSTSSCSPLEVIRLLPSSRSQTGRIAITSRWVTAGDKQVRAGSYVKHNGWLRISSCALRSTETTRSASTTVSHIWARRLSTSRSSTRMKTKTTTSWETSSATTRRWTQSITRSPWPRLRWVAIFFVDRLNFFVGGLQFFFGWVAIFLLQCVGWMGIKLASHKNSLLRKSKKGFTCSFSYLQIGM